MKKLVNLKGTKVLNKKEQRLINGGNHPFDPPRGDCGCIVLGNQGYLEIVSIDCNSTCPDGSPPIPGLGQ